MLRSWSGTIRTVPPPGQAAGRYIKAGEIFEAHTLLTTEDVIPRQMGDRTKLALALMLVLVIITVAGGTEYTRIVPASEILAKKIKKLIL